MAEHPVQEVCFSRWIRYIDKAASVLATILHFCSTKILAKIKHDYF